MSRQDPGAATGAGVYVFAPLCVCGCSDDLHDPKRPRRCSNSQCACTGYVPGAPEPDRCPTCGAHWNAIEAARLANGT